MRRGAVNARFLAVPLSHLRVAYLLALCLGICGCAAIPPFSLNPNSPRAKQHAKEEAQKTAHCQELSQQAQAAIDGHDDPKAESLLRKLVALEPKSAEAHHRLGRVLQAEGRIDEAAAEYSKALVLDREYVNAMIGLGTIEMIRGRAQAGVARFESAIENNPRNSEAHFELAKAMESLKRTDDALASYFRTIEFAPNSLEARLRVAAIQIDRDEPDQALARLDPLIDQYPDDAEARHQRGRANLALKRIGPAVNDLKLAAEKLPDRPDIHYHFALALEADHKTKAALDSANRALKIAPNYADARELSEKLRR